MAITRHIGANHLIQIELRRLRRHLEAIISLHWVIYMIGKNKEYSGAI